jgi:hypothetical protein
MLKKSGLAGRAHGFAMMLAYALLTTAVFVATPSFAADKGVGGDCCSDLEERIAELEATTAKKGNRKVSLTISGQINKSLMWVSDGDDSNTAVTENSAAESYVGFAGKAKVTPDFSVGFVLQLGVGGYDQPLNLGQTDTNGVYTRQSYLYLEYAKVGKVSLGHLSQATDGIVEISTANTDAATRMLSLRPLVGPQLGEMLDVFDGGRVDGVRFDSAAVQGFMVSASWGNADLIDEGNTYDIALRYAGEFQQVKIAAGVGYRQGIVVPTLGAAEEIVVWGGSASLMHVPTGLFVTGAYGHVEGEGVLAFLPVLKGWQVQGGLEERWNKLGKTTAFAEFGELDLEGFAGSPRLYGLGVVQAIDAAALDVYLSWRRYELDAGSDDSLDVVLGGARIKF